MRVIAGTAKGVSLKTPDGLATRPTAERVKEALFSMIHFDIPGKKILDLFAGTGQLGIEALSRGAKFAVFTDAREEACKLVRENVQKCRFSQQAQVLRADYKQFLHNCKDRFDIIFLDPPYVEVFLENSLKIISEIDILQSGGIIITERPADKPLTMEISGFSRSKDYKYGNTVITVFRKEY